VETVTSLFAERRAHVKGLNTCRCALFVALVFTTIALPARAPTAGSPPQQSPATATDPPAQKPIDPDKAEPEKAEQDKSDQKTGTPVGQKPLTPEEERQAQLVADTNRLFQLAQELQAEVAKSTKNTLSLSVVKKAAEVEKLARSLKERMRTQ
jgi:hypothetical protein